MSEGVRERRRERMKMRIWEKGKEKDEIFRCSKGGREKEIDTKREGERERVWDSQSKRGRTGCRRERVRITSMCESATRYHHRIAQIPAEYWQHHLHLIRLLEFKQKWAKLCLVKIMGVVVISTWSLCCGHYFNRFKTLSSKIDSSLFGYNVYKWHKYASVRMYRLFCNSCERKNTRHTHTLADREGENDSKHTWNYPKAVRNSARIQFLYQIFSRAHTHTSHS